MARSDLLQSLVAFGTQGDGVRFRRTVEAIIAEERSKQHHVLADQLERSIRVPASEPPAPVQLNGGSRIDELLTSVAPRRCLEDLFVAEATARAFRELVEEHQRADLLRSHNLEPRNRVLLTGPPGNGKTSLAEVVATMLGVPMFSLRYDGVIGSFLGETAGRLRRVFDFVRTRPCVLFLDEFDAIGKERGDTHETGEIKRVVSSLLLQVDVLPSYVVLVAATNHWELLDRAVWRRFQVRIELPRPTRRQVEEWATRVAVQLGFSFEYSSRRIADALHGASYADLEEFAHHVARRRVLGIPSPDVRAIVREALAHWRAQLGKSVRPQTGRAFARPSNTDSRNADDGDARRGAPKPRRPD